MPPRPVTSDTGEGSRSSGRLCVPTYKNRDTSQDVRRARGGALSRLATSSSLEPAVMEGEDEIDEESCPVEAIADLNVAGASTQVD